jgi:hypothetical protein
MRDRAPAYRGHVLNFDALRFAALREGHRPEEALATENEGVVLHGPWLHGPLRIVRHVLV